MKVNWFHLMPCHWLPKVQIIPGAGHMALLEQTRVTTRAIFEFCLDWV